MTNLFQVWENPIVREAIFLASPELYTELDKGLAIGVTNNRLNISLKHALLKYLSRMTSRCTPFGIFAGCVLGSFDKNTRVILEDLSKYKRQTRFDMNFLVAWSQRLSEEKGIRKQLLWYPNTSLYKIGNQYRYIEYTYTKHNNRSHALEAVTYSQYLQTVLERAKQGANHGDLALVLVDKEISIEEAEDFIDELIDNQILIGELEPTVTGEDFLLQIQKVLSRYVHTEQLCTFISDVNDVISTLDTQIGNTIQPYNEICEILTKKEITYKSKYLFQTDLYPKLSENQLDIKWGYKLKRLLPVLNKITPTYQDTNLDRFITAFSKRYETREIPLTIALDTEIGIGYLQHQSASDSTPFLEDLLIPSKVTQQQQISWHPFYEVLDKKLQESKYILEIEDKDLTNFTENWNDLPDTMSAMVELVKLNNEEKMVLSSVGGTSATNLLGRFTTGDTELNKLVTEIAEIEQQMNPDMILAEIIHLPESRTGNVIRRTSIREYEIPYLGKSSVPQKNQILIDDLMISIKQGNVLLRSKRLNKYVLPRLSNAHNYSANALPIYHFLCDLQQQKTRSGIGFYWGAVFQNKSFLPRVVYKDFILAKARWKIHKEEIQDFLTYTPQQLLEHIDSWRLRHSIPAMVQLIDGDNTLLINLESPNAIQMWLDTIKKRSEFIIEEFLFVEDSIVKRGIQDFTNQFVISFYNEEKLKKSGRN
ncbi:lantibiotic dehydratase family protein [Aquimarina sp. MMG016]|uniref:lantibiotic dehydratase family protein n=1 Tax=Aquimarina sp. MMG016 TaxID=2822690 RepID=UPI001B3A61C2|nr:lantibiotic dehydratase family protein [Aquimarina sp. MMG016]MBQ4821834.1 lantibiotic dehydratase family protein [Aquimarina sp. MMG016]